MTDRRRAPPTVTLADVARAAGVGESTVSRVVRNQGSFSPEVRNRVTAAVARLGYVPNRIAGSLASTGSHLVAIIVPSLANIVFPDVLSGANAVLTGVGCQWVVGVTDYDTAVEDSLVVSLLAWRPRGLIIAGLDHSDHARRMLQASGIRIAEVLDLDGTGIDILVGFSQREAGRASARHLLSRGYRRIGHVGQDPGRDPRAGKRLAGFRGVLAEAGTSLVDEIVVASPSTIEAGRDGLAILLARRPDLDAVYFANDDLAMGGYFLCLARGIAVPERLALFGFNGLDVGRLAPQPLSTILTPRREAGEVAARLVVGDEPAATVDLGFTLVEGATA